MPINKNLSKKPILVQQWNDSDLWYKQDDKFKSPIAKINLKIYTNDCMYGHSPEGRVFAEIWNSIIHENLREFYYMGKMASQETYITIYNNNLNFEWFGYNDTLSFFVQEAIN